jgi:hypothetical protein
MQSLRRIGQRTLLRRLSKPSEQIIIHFHISLLIRHIIPRMATSAIRGRIVRDFQTQLYKTCGVRTIVLLAYGTEDGKPQIAMYVDQPLLMTGH